MIETDVKFPLRPTLLVIASDKGYEAKSLAEITARTYAGNMRRLTEKFSQHHWNITICDMGDEKLLESVWASFETSNMAIIIGYDGRASENKNLSKITLAAQPLVTLVNLEADLEGANLRLFNKTVSLLLPQGLKEQFVLTDSALRETRQENTWGKWEDRHTSVKSRKPPRQKTIN